MARDLWPHQLERYHRNLLLPEVGPEGQRQLLEARVLVVGAGGLGSPVLLYLAAAGVGHLGIADGGAVELGNLQRQIIHDMHDLGREKVLSAAAAVAALNGDVEVEPVAGDLNAASARDLLARYDVVCDCTDSTASRALIHAAAFAARRPLVWAAVHAFEGQLSTFRGFEEGKPCCRCLFPEPAPVELVPPASEVGLLGVLPGVMGTLQALETVKEILKLGDRLVGRLLLFDALACSFRVVSYGKDPGCALCGRAAS